MKRFIVLFLLSAINLGGLRAAPADIPLADPFVYQENGLYYLYGTGSPDGIAVCVSTDLLHWQWPDDKQFYLALHKEDSYGDFWFWAPEVYKVGETYYMYYSAEEHLCVATSSSPLGPFVQDVQEPVKPEKCIDGTMYIDDDGTPYLIWVSITDHEEIWIAELEADLKHIKEGTEQYLMQMSQDWEKVWPGVNEGPFVLKHDGTYYLSYSANSYESPKYGIGYATAPTLRGPWTKAPDNPILQCNGGLEGVGHHAFFTDAGGKKRIAYHSHNRPGVIHPRVLHIGEYRFAPDGRLEISQDFITPELVQGVRMPKNPLPVALGDPFVLKAPDGRYYMYGTSLEDGFEAYSSDDLSEWRPEGKVYQGAAEGSWTTDCFWAPEVYYRGGRYYMFFSSNWKVNPHDDLEVFRIGVAVSDSPTGPFKDLSDKPLFDPGYPIIDADVYFDEQTGRAYLYYSRCCYKHPVRSQVARWARKKGLFKKIEESWIYGVEIKPDFSGVKGRPKLLLRPPKRMDDPQAEWESRSVTNGEAGRRWTEGSYTFRYGDTYYMLYSANFFGGGDYAVGYATSKKPLGRYRKSRFNPLLQKDSKVSGTGHCMVLKVDGNNTLIVYHGKAAKTGDTRLVFIDRLWVDADGRLRTDGPSFSNPDFE